MERIIVFLFLVASCVANDFIFPDQLPSRMQGSGELKFNNGPSFGGQVVYPPFNPDYHKNQANANAEANSCANGNGANANSKASANSNGNAKANAHANSQVQNIPYHQQPSGYGQGYTDTQNFHNSIASSLSNAQTIGENSASAASAASAAGVSFVNGIPYASAAAAAAASSSGAGGSSSSSSSSSSSNAASTANGAQQFPQWYFNFRNRISDDKDENSETKKADSDKIQLKD